jgi:hypothetical protein
MADDLVTDLVKTLLPFVKWILIGLFVLHFFCLFDKKKGAKTSDIKTRMWRKFQYVNAELIPHLDHEEKKSMVEVLKTTLANAELFKNKDKRISHSDSPRKRSAKKVTFNPQMVSSRILY